MKRYMLDTNICIYIMQRQPPEVAQRFAQCHYGDVVISSITLAELWHGVQLSGERKQHNERALQALLEDIPALSFAQSDARRYADIRAASKQKRSAFDHLIAAHAMAEQCVLVTNNSKDFAYLPQGKVENWVV
jgi:tRNA(fMet)-specific endonuclease VapC